MKRTVSVLLLISAALLFFAGSVYGGWKNKIVLNQVKASEYISKLQKGTNPKKLSRPSLRRDAKACAKAANRELRAAMDRAEKLARLGRSHLIENPDFRTIVSGDGYKRVKKRYEKGN